MQPAATQTITATQDRGAALQISCDTEPEMRVLAEKDTHQIRAQFYELMALRIKISFFDASAIKSDYIFHEYFKSYTSARDFH